MHVLITMTYGNSFVTWEDAGILDRELALYMRHVESGVEISFLSYGGSLDQTLMARFPTIKVLTNRWRLPMSIYAVLVPILFRSTLKRVDIIKSNQMYGSHVANWCNWIYKKKFVLRQGHDFVEHFKKEKHRHVFYRWLSHLYERFQFRQADAAVFTSDKMLEDAKIRYAKPPETSLIIPNYIDSGAWDPGYDCATTRDRLRVAYFGRFTAQKNLEALIEAISQLPVDLVLIGEGDTREKLEKLTKSIHASCEFVERVPQKRLVAILNRCNLFALPSHYEGNPKSLIEAMAFGIPVLVADSPGIRELVIPGVDAIVVEPTVTGIRDGLRIFINMSAAERRQLGRYSRESVLREYSVDRIACLERDLFRRLLENPNEFH